MGDWPLLNTLKAFQIHTSPKFNKTMEDFRTEAWQINFTPYACTYSVSSLLSPLEHIERWWRRSVWKSLMKHDEAKADLIIFFVRGTFLRALGKQLVLVAVFIMKLICLSNEKGLRYFPQIMLSIRNLWVRFLDVREKSLRSPPLTSLEVTALPSQKDRGAVSRKRRKAGLELKKIRDYYVVFHCHERRCTLISRPLTANYFIS